MPNTGKSTTGKSTGKGSAVKKGNAGNFANDREKASEAGKKGGRSPSSGRN